MAEESLLAGIAAKSLERTAGIKLVKSQGFLFQIIKNIKIIDMQSKGSDPCRVKPSFFEIGLFYLRKHYFSRIFKQKMNYNASELRKKLK
jgi:hypothetical protein